MECPSVTQKFPPRPAMTRARSYEPTPEEIEIREKMVEAARQGLLCPADQLVCEMSLWKVGNYKGFEDGLLAYRGETLEKHAASVAAGDYIKINKEALDRIFYQMKTFNNMEMSYCNWTYVCFDGKLPCDYYELPHKNLHPMYLNVFTRAQLHNHLMMYKAAEPLTDEKWEEFKKRWPN